MTGQYLVASCKCIFFCGLCLCSLIMYILCIYMMRYFVFCLEEEFALPLYSVNKLYFQFQFYFCFSNSSSSFTSNFKCLAIVSLYIPFFINDYLNTTIVSSIQVFIYNTLDLSTYKYTLIAVISHNCILYSCHVLHIPIVTIRISLNITQPPSFICALVSFCKYIIQYFRFLFLSLLPA